MKRIIAVFLALCLMMSIALAQGEAPTSILVSEIHLSQQDLILPNGKTTTLKASVLPKDAKNKKVGWTSSDDTIATVSKTGKITPQKAGSCVIICSAMDGSGVKAECTLTVNQLVEKISLGDSKLLLKQGTTKLIARICYPNNATNTTLEWSSSNPSIATVDQLGLITAISGGSSTITCEATDGSRKKATIRVDVEPKYIASLTKMKVGHNSIGSPEVYVAVKNVGSSDNIIAFTFATRCYDAYGNLLKAHGFGDTTEYWIWQEGILKPKKSTSASNWRWTLYGFDTAYRIDVWLTDYRTSSGTTVNIPESDSQVFTWNAY